MASPDLMEAFGRGLIAEEQVKVREIVRSNIIKNGNAGPYEGIFVRHHELLKASDYSPAARRQVSCESGLISTLGRTGHKLYKLWSANRPL